ncbi:MAG: aldo/keto reductase [Spirochaetes bacterium]|nr:aldo/keto reductase [Spirochaetota bacterium]
MIPRLPFGRTGHDSSRLLFGAAALGEVSRAEADRALGEALDAGLNHFDTAASYGHAEEVMGPWVADHRDEIFLATKTQKRGKKEALAELETSLSLLGTDHVDLWQMHILIEEEEWETAMAEEGALEAFVEARKQGKTRFLGVTGHGRSAPAMHLKSLSRFDFDSVLFPWNPAHQGLPAAPLGRPAPRPGYLVRTPCRSRRHRPGPGLCLGNRGSLRQQRWRCPPLPDHSRDGFQGPGEAHGRRNDRARGEDGDGDALPLTPKSDRGPPPRLCCETRYPDHFANRAFRSGIVYPY